jgi:hypothetical protein
MPFATWERIKLAYAAFKASKDYLARYERAPQIAELVDLQNNLAESTAERLRLTESLATATERIAELERKSMAAPTVTVADVELRNNAYWRRVPLEGGLNGPWCTRCLDLGIGALTLRRAGEDGMCPDCKNWHHKVWPLETGPTSPWRPNPHRTPRWLDRGG